MSKLTRIIFAIFLAAIYMLTKPYFKDGFGNVNYLSQIIFLVSITWIVKIILWIAGRIAQSRRDDDAPKEASSEKIVLFLRPFVSDSIHTEVNPDRSTVAGIFFGPFYNNITSKFVSIDRLILSCCNGRAIAIGRADGLVGTGKIPCSDWEKKFKELVAAAELIISIPSLHEGTIWELEWIKLNKFQNKLIMIFSNIHNSEKTTELDMQGIITRLRQLGYDISENTKPISIVSFDREPPRCFRYTVSNLQDLISARIGKASKAS